MERIRLLRECRLCPRECGVDRLNGQAGACGAPGQIMAARAALHMWEEPCLSGQTGSGTVFFSGCALKCRFCQNYEISQNGVGRAVSAERLSEIFLELQAQAASNINLVTATPYIPWLVQAIKAARAAGLYIPIVYNSSGYERVQSLWLLDGLVDIYLPDLKYMREETARAYSQAADYPQIAKLAIAEMVRQIGAPVLDECGIMQRGVMVRHLLLPGHVGEAKETVSYLHNTYEDAVYISIMNQYTPTAQVQQLPLLNRAVTEAEYAAVVRYAQSLGVERGFIQDGGTVSASFIPAFNGEGL